MQSGFGQFSTVYTTQGKELMLPKFTEKSGCKNQHFCSSSFQINREHASRPTCFLRPSRHFILGSNPSQEDNQEKVWLVPCLWKVCPLTRRHQQLGDACRALWGDCPGICALSASLRDAYACWFKLCLKGKASPTCCNYCTNFC